MKVEILAPCGSMEVLQSAIVAGCDACYLAGKSFGARAYANNFTDDELINAIDYAHLYGVKVFVTVNTIIFENEINDAVKFVDFLYENNADGVIVQDLGLASIIHHRYPDFRLHASTQINAQSVEDCKVLKSLGFTRIILGREVSLDTVKKIRENVDVELEVFSHGALCMSYSGSCYFSSMIGDRSGNRGRCAQPCRKSYTLDDKEAYYLSPKDLCTLDNINEISKYVDSIKIEGRMKSKEYVYDVVKAYREVIDKYNNHEYFNTANLKYDMQVDFNRGYTNGFIMNVNNKDFTNIDSSNHQGVLVGKVIESLNNKVVIRLTKDLQEGDSVRITGHDLEDSITINGMYNKSGLIKKATVNDVVTLRSHKVMPIGSLVYLTKREKEILFNKKVKISARIYTLNNRFYLEFNDGINIVSDSIKYEIAKNDLMERLIKQIKKTGETVYEVTEVINDCSDLVYVEIKEINELRRMLLEDLDFKRREIYEERKINDSYPVLSIGNIIEYKGINIALSDKEQLTKLNEWLDDYPLVCTKYTRFKDNDSLYYLPRVGGHANSKDAVSSNLGNITKVSSVYLNVSNSYTVRVLEHLGFEKIGLSIELSKADIKDLINGYRSHFNREPNLEIMIYGHYQLMYMKHCFLNKAYCHDNMHCGECKKDIMLDGLYPVLGDSECHLALLSKDPVYLFSKITELKNFGIKNFLIDFTKETELEDILSSYHNPYSGGYFGHYIKEIL